MTISVGFRAPTIHEIMNGLVSKAMSEGSETARYSDPDLKAQRPGEISPMAIKKVKSTIEKEMLSDTFIQDWLGTFSTEPYCDVEFQKVSRSTAPSVIRKALNEATTLCRAEGARFAYVRTGKDSIVFYANGHRSELVGRTARLAALIADRVTIPTSEIRALALDQRGLSFLKSFVESGVLVFD